MIATRSVWLNDEATVRELGRHALEFSAWLREHGYSEVKESDDIDQVIPSLLISQAPTRDELKVLHPATFPEPDIEKLIRFFTKSGELVVDPFVGSGTTCIAAMKHGRNSIGVELYEEWAALARKRIEAKKSHQLNMFSDEQSDTREVEATVLNADAAEAASSFADESIDFLVTSPPYWGILGKNKDHKVKAERIALNRPTDYGNDQRDLSFVESYPDFVTTIATLLALYVPKLKSGKYACVIVSDFRHKSRFHAYHSDLATAIECNGLQLEGITILAQTNKNLYPYGLPAAFVSNIHHQYVLIFRKRK